MRKGRGGDHERHDFIREGIGTFGLEGTQARGLAIIGAVALLAFAFLVVLAPLIWWKLISYVPALAPLAALRADRLLDVPEPRHAVLVTAVAQARAVRILVRDP